MPTVPTPRSRRPLSPDDQPAVKLRGEEKPRGLVGRAVGVSRLQLVGRAAQRLTSGYERVAQPVPRPGSPAWATPLVVVGRRGAEEAIVLRLCQTLVRLLLDDQFHRVQVTVLWRITRVSDLS